MSTQMPSTQTPFERQMAMYLTYHRDWRNKATHWVGIPLIVFSVVLATSLVTLPGGVHLSLILSMAVWALWVRLHPVVGVSMGVLLIPCLLLADSLDAALSVNEVRALAGGLFVGGWVLQLTGHAFEGRKPALLDNLFQALIGPMFLAADALGGLGLTGDLKARIQAIAAQRPQ